MYIYIYETKNLLCLVLGLTVHCVIVRTKKVICMVKMTHTPPHPVYFVQCWALEIPSAVRWSPASCWWVYGAAASLPSRKWSSIRCPLTRRCSWRALIRSAERMCPTVPLSASRSGTFLVRSISSTRLSTTRWYSGARERSFSLSTRRCLTRRC